MGKLFREEAAENYKEQFSIDKQVIKLSFSTAFLTLIFFLGLLVSTIWFAFGNIVNTVNINGVVYPTNGIEKIISSRTGMLSHVTVNIGEDVDVGDVIAVMPDEEILKKIDEAVKSGADENFIEKLRQDYLNHSVIVSESIGEILSVSNAGSYVRAGDIIASIAAKQEDNNERQIFAFLPASSKNNIEKGSAVQVSPNYAPREKYGYINGYIADIGNEIITKSDAQKGLDVYNIPNLLEDNETYIGVRINLLADENSPSGLKWSNDSSGKIDVEIGTVCSVSIVVSEQPPYKWLFGGESQ